MRLLLVLAAAAASSFAAKLEPLVPFEQQYLGPHQQANHPHTERGRASSCAGQCINIETFHCVDAGADVDTLVGKCPGANNIQCCPTPATPVDNGPNTCDHGSGVNGLCINTVKQECDGAGVLTGFCPGAIEIKCCPKPGAAVDLPTTCDASASNQAGECINTDTHECDGASVLTGHCSGQAHIKCCPHPGKPKAAASSSTCDGSGKSGECINTDTFSCDGAIILSGHCSGAGHIKCCPSPGQKVEVYTTMTCDVTGKVGECINTETHGCDGASLLNGHCSGSSQFKCCPHPGAKVVADSSSSSSAGLSSCQWNWEGSRESSIGALQPEFQTLALELAQALAADPVTKDLHVFETRRNLPNKCGLANPAVSQADPCKAPSRHGYGAAIDFVPKLPGWKWPSPKDYPGWDGLRKHATALGLDNDITWDRPHVQMRSRDWLTKWLQKDLGLTEDGRWGANTDAAVKQKAAELGVEWKSPVPTISPKINWNTYSELRCMIRIANAAALEGSADEGNTGNEGSSNDGNDGNGETSAVPTEDSSNSQTRKSTTEATNAEGGDGERTPDGDEALDAAADPILPLSNTDGDGESDGSDAGDGDQPAIGDGSAATWSHKLACTSAALVAVVVTAVML